MKAETDKTISQSCKVNTTHVTYVELVERVSRKETPVSNPVLLSTTLSSGLGKSRKLSGDLESWRETREIRYMYIRKPFAIYVRIMGENSVAVAPPPPSSLGVKFLDVGAFEIDAALDIAPPTVISAEPKLITVTRFIQRRISKETLAILLLFDRPDSSI